jgi:hypothetical protein
MLLSLSKWVALVGLMVCAAGLALRWRRSMRRVMARDLAPARGSARSGVVYSFSAGMMPWAKESTRRHMAAYLRGIGFHAGLFLGLPLLVVSPWWTLAPETVRLVLASALGVSALLALAGVAMRAGEKILRELSTADDYLALVLVSAFLALASAALAWAAWMPAMYLVAGVMLAYIPLGKIRHCLYFFFARMFFGQFVGRRAVIHPHAANAQPVMRGAEVGR